jgi:hypothetical protein
VSEQLTLYIISALRRVGMFVASLPQSDLPLT